MSRGGFVFVVVALLLCATIPALFTTTPTKGYPASPHYGNAYVGEFWLEEMNITLDTANSSGYDIAKMVKGHIKAQNDWIVYDPDNSIVANYSIQIGDEHPKFKLIMLLEVDAVRQDNTTCIGTTTCLIECGENQSYDLSGNLSVPLSDINFTGRNLTLVCSLRAVIFSKINVGLNIVKNVTYDVEDRSVVAVEESENTNTDFSWYINQADEYLPSIWKDVGGLQYAPPEAQTVWGVEQTVVVFIDEAFGTNASSNQSGDNNTIEWETWKLARATIRSYDPFDFSDFDGNPFNPIAVLKYLLNRRIVEITEFLPIKQEVAWNVSDDEWKKGVVTGSASVFIKILWNDGINIPILVKWGIVKGVGDYDSVTAKYVHLFKKHNESTMSYPVWCDSALTVYLNDLDKNKTQTQKNFKIYVQANLPRETSSWYHRVYLYRVNNSDNDTGNNNSTTTNTYYPTWANAVAYRVIAATPIEVTPLTEGSITTEKMNISNFVRNSLDDVYIYIYGGDTGDYRVDIDG